MEYSYLGRTGLKVSKVCLGTMTFTDQDTVPPPAASGPGGPAPALCDQATSHAILDRFVELGGNFIDTADVYTQGASERCLGNWLAKNAERRDSLVIATKIRFGSGSDKNGIGLSRKHVVLAVDQCLKRLQTPYIDLLQMHCWDQGTPIEETLMAVKDLISAGKILYFGISNVTGWQLQKIVDEAKRLGLPPIASLQAQYNLLCRWTEWELQEVCDNEGLGLLPWSPLKGGWLSGKINSKTRNAPGDSRVAWAESAGSKLQSHPAFSLYADNEQVWKLLSCLEDTAADLGRSVAQVSLKWLLQQRAVSSVVIGVRKLSQLEDNVEAGQGWQLSQEQLDQLNEHSAVEVPYPYEMVWRCQIPRK